MNRVEFMKQLERLLGDIQENDDWMQLDIIMIILMKPVWKMRRR